MTKKGNFDYDVFLSHNHQDKCRVGRLAKRLRARGLRVWYDEWVIRPGDNIFLAIERGLEAARVQVLCLSRAALGADWVNLERSTAMFRDPDNTNRRFVPLLLENCELPDTLRRLKYIDFSKESDAAFAQLVAHLQGSSSRTHRPAQTKQDKGRKIPPAETADEEEALLSQIRNLVDADLAARDKLRRRQGPNRTWFVPPLAFCNYGSEYVPRPRVQEGFAKWLHYLAPPVLFLIGPSGIGKTNFLVAEETLALCNAVGPRGGQHTKLPVFRAILFFNLGALQSKRTLLENLRRHCQPAPDAPVHAAVLERLIRDGKILLILDGLDEFVRNKGEGGLKTLLKQIQTLSYGYPCRIVVSCRHHIYRRILRRGLLPQGSVEPLKVPNFTPAEIRAMLTPRLEKDPKWIEVIMANRDLVKLASTPLLLELICRIPSESLFRLAQCQTAAAVYDLCIKEMLEYGASGGPTGDGSHEAAYLLAGQVAGLMLKQRSDLVSESALRRYGIRIKRLEALARPPFGLLVKQTKSEWSFVHDSFREFALAKAVSMELVAGRYELLKDTASFDYVGAETHEFLIGLLGSAEKFLVNVKDALGNSLGQGEDWNNLVRNRFEAIGMVAEDNTERFIRLALKFLQPARGGLAGTGRVGTSTRTQYNIVRCLERLHPLAPRPYYKQMVDLDWDVAMPEEGSFFGAYAMRGFHLKRPGPGAFPPLRILAADGESGVPCNRVVSKCLLQLIERHAASHKAGVEKGGRVLTDEEGLVLNCSMALVRWLAEPHVARLKHVLRTRLLSPMVRGNLFLAFYVRNNPLLLRGCSELFDGMELNWVRFSKRKLPDDFAFIRCRFLDCNRSDFRGLDVSELTGCQFLTTGDPNST